MRYPEESALQKQNAGHPEESDEGGRLEGRPGLQAHRTCFESTSASSVQALSMTKRTIDGQTE